MGTRLRVLGLFVGVMVIPASSSSEWKAMPPLDERCDVELVELLIDGQEGALTSLRAGSRLQVTIEVPDGCRNRLTLASFVAPEPAFDGSRLSDQVAHDRATGFFEAGRHELAVSVYDFPEVEAAACEAAREQLREERAAVVAAVRAEAQADAAVMARLRDELASTKDDAAPPSAAVGPIDVPCGQGPPCDGCVGNADDKDPPGQDGGGDRDAGYECDRNLGIGQGNPAHSGCPNVQVDLAYRPVVDSTSAPAAHPSGLVFGYFCDRTAGVCYLTDNTGPGTVAAMVDER